MSFVQYKRKGFEVCEMGLCHSRSSTARGFLDRAMVGNLSQGDLIPRVGWPGARPQGLLPSAWFVIVFLTTVAWLLTLSPAVVSLGPE